LLDRRSHLAFAGTLAQVAGTDSPLGTEGEPYPTQITLTVIPKRWPPVVRWRSRVKDSRR